MNIAIIGRGEALYDTTLKLIEEGHQVSLIVTAKEAPEYTKTATDYESLATKINAHFINTSKLTPAIIKSATSNKWKADLAISINYINIISQEVIDLFTLGVLNAHGGDLPRYRGNACQAWAIINQEKQIGLCIHKMVGGQVDAGDIIERKYYPIDINTRIGQVYEWLEKDIPILFLQAVQKLSTNPEYVLTKQSSNPVDALRCYPRNPDDGKIDWNQSNEDVLRLINASSEPYSGAFCLYKGNKMVIWRAELYQDEENYLAIPGQVASFDQTTGLVVVITGNGKLLLKEIEYQNIRTSPGNVIKSIRKRLH